MSPRPVTPELVAAALVAACRVRGVEPEQAFERRAGRRQVRILAAAGLLKAGVGPQWEIAQKLSIGSDDLRPSRRDMHNVTDDAVAQVAAPLADMPPKVADVPDVVPSNEGTGWNANRTALLKKLYARGWSATEIAKRLGGVTRNAVIGKVHRLGLCRPADAANRLCRATPERVRVPSVPELKREAARKVREAKAAAKAERDAAKAAAQPQPTETAKAPFLSLVVGEPVRFVDLPARGCRWPISLSVHEEAGQDTLFCGAESYREGDPQRPYCRAHYHATDKKVGAYLPKKAKGSANELIRSCRRFA